MTTLPTQAQALRYHQFGKAADVLRLETVALPPLGPDDALLRTLAAPVNPADFGSIAGTYGALPPLPAAAGLEGVAEVLALGPQAQGISLGQRVFLSGGQGAWQSHIVAPAESLFPAPQDLPLEIAAMGWVNPPTAWKLLHDFAQLKAGDWIAQNAATSAVGKLVIQFANHLGIRTINLVRSLDSSPRLKQLGADVVLLDDKDAAKRALAATGGAQAQLAFNSVGGSSAYGLCKLLADSATLVTFGGMDRDPAPFPTRYLIFNDLRLRGLWVTQWYQQASRQQVLALHQQIFSFMAHAKIEIDLGATFPLASYREALAYANQPGKPGKAILVP